MKYLWLAVTTDKYEFPIYIADTSNELAKKLGTTGNAIRCAVSKQANGQNTKRKIVKVEI